MIAITQIFIEVTDVTGNIGRRWDDGTTTVILWPKVPPETVGVWESARPGDLDSDAGSPGSKPNEDLKRTYDFSTTNKALYLRVYSEDQKKRKKGKEVIKGKTGEPVTTVLTLDKFNINTPDGTSGTGKFPFRGMRGHNLPVDWRVAGTVTVDRTDPPPPKDKVILDRRYRLRPNDPALIKQTTQGFQEYEYYNNRQQLLYVGATGGRDGKDPSNWVDRLHKSHITTQWIGEATTIVVTYGLNRQEAWALEETEIPNAKYNIKPGEHSSQYQQGSTSENALAASKHGSRETFWFELLPAE
jgi:hypothetical protein